MNAPGWLSGLAVKQLMLKWVDGIDRGCVAELPRAVRIGQLLLPRCKSLSLGPQWKKHEIIR